MSLFVLLLLGYLTTNTWSQSTPICDIRDYGAIGDNKTINTKSIISTINECHNKYGVNNLVSIYIANGTYITGPFNLTSNTILYLNNNATLAASTDPNDYGLCECSPPSNTRMYCPVIGSFNTSNISIIGNANYNIHNPWKSTSNIDGRGEPWWYNFSQNLLKYQRPKLIEFINCNNINIHNVTVFNSSFWTIHPIYCQNVYISNINVFAPRAIGNTDGIDPDSSTNVHINNAYIDVGDDGISVKSYNNIPAKNILIENTYILSRNFAIGSAVYGGVENMTFRNGIIGDNNGSSPWAIKIKTHRGGPPNGGYVKNILFENLKFGYITGNTWQQPNGGQDIEFDPTYGATEGAFATVNNIMFRNITGFKDKIAGILHGANSTNIWNNITFENVIFNNSQNGWNCKYVNVTQKGTVIPPIPSNCILK